MVAIPPLGSTLGILSAIGSLFTVGNAIKALHVKKKIKDTGSSITQLSSQTSIISRAFIDEGIIDEPLLPNLMKSIHTWYAAQIIAALQLSRMVDDQKTVQSIMSVVQTGQSGRQGDWARNNVFSPYLKRAFAQESFLSNYLGKEDALGLEAFSLVTDEQIDVLYKKNKELGEENKTLKEKHMANNTQIKSVNASDNRIGPMGELFEITLSHPTGNSMKIPVFIQMQPSIMPVTIAPRFIDLNVSPSTWKRWTQMRAGEMGFWKDFLLGRDRFKRKMSFIKDPQASKSFTEFMKTISKKDTYALGDLTATDGLASSNLANSVTIFSEDTINRAKLESGIDLHDVGTRKKYFRDTYSMIIVIVDPVHQRVTVYFNGLDGELDSSYSDFKPNNKNFDPADFMQALQAFSSGSAGRLR